MKSEWILALIGGGLIGISVSLMMLLHGRVTGISGIINGVLMASKKDILWRVSFILGLMFAGVLLNFIYPSVFFGQLKTNNWIVIIAGLLVGFGTIMGSGCTSGHGVCGVSRLSPRSLIATIVFILGGVLTVTLIRSLEI